jgi:hypothetical protein
MLALTMQFSTAPTRPANPTRPSEERLLSEPADRALRPAPPGSTHPATRPPIRPSGRAAPATIAGARFGSPTDDQDDQDDQTDAPWELNSVRDHHTRHLTFPPIRAAEKPPR